MRRLIFASILLFLLASCHTPSVKESKNALQLTDSYGRNVSVKRNPRRIISLSSAITESIFLLESEDKLVGISDFCDYPEATKNIEHVGGLQNISIEKLLSLQPDLVLIGSIVSKEDVEKMEQAGMTVLALRAESSIYDIIPLLETLGEILDKTDLAQQKTAELKSKMDSFSQSEGAAKPKTVYYVVGFGDGGDYTAPGNSHIDEIITLAGGHNVGHDLTTWNISREYLFQIDPDIILIRKENYEQFIHTHPYTQLSAVKNNQVFPIESGWIDNVSPRNLEAAKRIREIIEN